VNQSISKKERDALDNTLYVDAKRRREDNIKKKEELDLVRDLPKEKMFKNSNTDKIVMESFERELKRVE
jgi:signal transduction histidine kinase